MRVGAHAGVGVCLKDATDLARHGDPRQVLDVDLVHDSRSRWHNLEVVERRLAPAQELVALAVSFVLDSHVALERVCFSVDIGNDRVVDNQFGGSERVNALGVATQCRHGFAHRGQVNDAGNAGEVLHDHTCR